MEECSDFELCDWSESEKLDSECWLTSCEWSSSDSDFPIDLTMCGTSTPKRPCTVDVWKRQMPVSLQESMETERETSSNLSLTLISTPESCRGFQGNSKQQNDATGSLNCESQGGDLHSYNIDANKHNLHRNCDEAKGKKRLTFDSNCHNPQSCNRKISELRRSPRVPKPKKSLTDSLYYQRHETAN